MSGSVQPGRCPDKASIGDDGWPRFPMVIFAASSGHFDDTSIPGVEIRCRNTRRTRHPVDIGA